MMWALASRLCINTGDCVKLIVRAGHLRLVDIDVTAPQGYGPDADLIETAAQFGRSMQELRERSGLSIREVAKQCNRPAATIGDHFSGAHLPNDRELLALILTVCGEDQERIERWQLALTRARRRPRRRGTNPYRGLARFEASDAKWFFGREDVTSLLWSQAAVPSELPLLLIGPSGAGKSSVLRAGLIPRLAEQSDAGPAAVYDLTVTGVTELADVICQLTAEPKKHGDAAGGGQTVVVDQFEAVFTLCDDEHERGRLIGALCELSRSALVVLALRADFYGLAIRYPGLRRALQDRQVLLGPMTAEQVRNAVVQPAELIRVGVDQGLVAMLLNDLAPADGGGDAAYESGALPLLSHALLATWEHSSGEMLTVSDYVASGGIRDALTRTADQAYESLGADQQELARQLFLRLVHVSEEMAPSRASVALGDLPGAMGGGDAEQVLATFVRERMITVDADAAQITHDALLTAWPRLQLWIKTDIERLRDRSRILAGARAWVQDSQEEAQLWRGSRLALAQEWATVAGNRAILSDQALSFVDACVAAADATAQAARRRTRRLQSTVAVLTVLVVAVAALSVYSSIQRAAARAAVGRAVTAANLADSNDVAFTADQLRGQDPAVAAQLSVSAGEFARSQQSTASLLESSGAPLVTRILDSAGIVQWVAVSPDRRLLAAAGDDGTLRLWNVTVPGQPTLVSDLVKADSKEPLYAAEFSPDGKLLVAAGANGLVRIWDVAGVRAVPLSRPLSGTTGNVYSLAFSPDSTTLAAASTNGTVRLWHVSDPARPTADGAPLAFSATYPNSVAFSPDGHTLAAGTESGTVWLWHLPDAGSTVRTAPVPLSGMPLSGPGGPVSGVAFSPDGRELAASSKDFKVWLWRVADGRAVLRGTLTGATNWVNTVAFSPDGKSVAAGTSAADVLVWNLETGKLTATLPHPQPVTSVTWDGTGRVVAAGADGTVSLWSLLTNVLSTGDPPTNVAYSPDGTTLAVGGSVAQLWNTATRTLLASHSLPPNDFANATVFRPKGAGAPLIAVAVSDGTVELLNGRTLAPVSAPFKVITGSGAAESVAFSPDGRLLAAGADDGTVRLFDVTNPAGPRQVAVVRGEGPITPIYTVAFAPDGDLIAAASLNNVVQLWRVSGSALASAGPELGGMASYPIGLAFAPDGRTLAIGNADKHVYLWNVTRPAKPQRLGAPLSGPSSNVWTVAFSPDGKTLAAGANDGAVWLWGMTDPAHPALTATLSGLPGHVFSIAFSPDGAQLAAASYDDDTVRLWDTSPATARASICANLGQPLNPSEWTSYASGVPYRQPCS
jgi:WD40 repeat protein